ncbi:MAG: chlorophyll synthase ChlG [Roseiflexaceae bacterium]|nr:chlorophyll synthase ChlG [Roseiflexaceae bacterium]
MSETLSTRVASTRPSVLRRSVALMKPVTWFAPAWAFVCGSVASSGSAWSIGHVGRVMLGTLLAGPVLCGLSQVINDWCDRNVDAINEPQRLIPSGQVSTRQVFVTIAVLAMAAMSIALYLGARVALLTGFGMIFAVLYSAPPVRAKRNSWIGSTMVGISYEGLPWVAGSLAFGALSWPSAALAAMFSFGTLGIMAINDFKSIEGDRATGISTLPVMYGPQGAAWLVVLIMTTAQSYVVMLNAVWGNYIAAALIALLVAAAVPLQRTFLQDPIANAIKFSAGASGLFVLGMIISAVAAR